MAASYPGAVKSFSAVVNGVTKLVASLFNSPYDEITAIETELGTDVAGSAADLKTRLAVSINADGTLVAFSKYGQYIGTGSYARTIPHGLGAAPNVVYLIDVNGGAVGMWVTGMTNCVSAGTGEKDAVTVDATNITLNTGAGAQFNQTSDTNYFLVFKTQ